MVELHSMTLKRHGCLHSMRRWKWGAAGRMLGESPAQEATCSWGRAQRAQASVCVIDPNFSRCGV